MTETPVNTEEPTKTVLVYGKDYVTLSASNIPEVEEFIGSKLEGDERGVWYGFPNDGKSRRVRITDRLTLEGEKVVVWPVKNFKAEFDVKDKTNEA